MFEARIANKMHSRSSRVKTALVTEKDSRALTISPVRRRNRMTSAQVAEITLKNGDKIKKSIKASSYNMNIFMKRPNLETQNMLAKPKFNTEVQSKFNVYKIKNEAHTFKSFIINRTMDGNGSSEDNAFKEKFSNFKIIQRLVKNNLVDTARPNILVISERKSETIDNYRAHYIKNLTNFSSGTSKREKPVLYGAQFKKASNLQNDRLFGFLDISQNISNCCNSMIEDSLLKSYIKKKSFKLKSMYKSLDKKYEQYKGVDSNDGKLKYFSDNISD
jgi:hypothetical protein